MIYSGLMAACSKTVDLSLFNHSSVLLHTSFGSLSYWQTPDVHLKPHGPSLGNTLCSKMLKSFDVFNAPHPSRRWNRSAFGREMKAISMVAPLIFMVTSGATSVWEKTGTTFIIIWTPAIVILWPAKGAPPFHCSCWSWVWALGGWVQCKDLTFTDVSCFYF